MKVLVACESSGIARDCYVLWCSYRGKFVVGSAEIACCGRYLPMIVESALEGMAAAMAQQWGNYGEIKHGHK